MALFEIDESSGLPYGCSCATASCTSSRPVTTNPATSCPACARSPPRAAINYNTVSKVYVNLESDGYVESVRGRGVFVRDIGRHGR